MGSGAEFGVSAPAGLPETLFLDLSPELSLIVHRLAVVDALAGLVAEARRVWLAREAGAGPAAALSTPAGVA